MRRPNRLGWIALAASLAAIVAVGVASRDGDHRSPDVTPSKRSNRLGAAGNLAASGRAVAESVLDDRSFPASAAIDGDDGTSWLSAAAGDDDVTSFTWTADESVHVTEIVLVGNGNHADPTLRTAHGFARVEVEVTDDEHDVVFATKAQLPGTPDPTLNLRLDVEATRVELRLVGPESETGSGFAELLILGDDGS